MVLTFAIALAVCGLGWSPVARMLTRGLAVPNYLGQQVPTAMGVVLLAGLLTGLVGAVFSGATTRTNYVEWALWFVLVALAGLLDDSAGNHRRRGFRGHFTALGQGELTTGLVKVVVVTAGAVLLVAWPFSHAALVDVPLLLVAVNFFNQLDTRPGRALKVFVVIAAALAAAGTPVAAAGAGAALGLLPGDLRARYMLGDTGANLLGAVAGLALLEVLTLPARALVLMLLLVANGLGELYSFNRLIEASPFLSWLDRIGRRQAGE